MPTASEVATLKRQINERITSWDLDSTSKQELVDLLSSENGDCMILTYSKNGLARITTVAFPAL